jgi:hypothetical protein
MISFGTFIGKSFASSINCIKTFFLNWYFVKKNENYPAVKNIFCVVLSGILGWQTAISNLLSQS